MDALASTLNRNMQALPDEDQDLSRLLSLRESMELDISQANTLYSAHLNKYMLQVLNILGMRDMDIVSAQGMDIRLADGRTILDFSTGLGVAALGHNHPRIIAAERACHERQVIDCIKLAPHKLQGALAYNLSRFLPAPLDVSFFAVSGSEANEAAMKLCERIQMPKQKQKFICMQGGFHGKTHGALSLTTAADFQRGFLLGIPQENILCLPYGDIDAMRAAIAKQTGRRGGNDIIATIIEPLRGTACELPPPGFLTEAARLCRDNDILCIFDEVKVGMGRTGHFCAFQREDVVPDIVTLAKTLGGGKRAMGAMVTSQALFDRAYGNKKDCNLHSSSFSGLGESCAVAIETLNIIADEALLARARERGAYLETGLRELQRRHPGTIREVRGMGLFQALRLNFRTDYAAKLIDVSRNPLIQTYQTLLIGAMVRELYETHGILVHFQPGARDILHFMPPFVVEEADIDRLITALDTIFTKGLADSTIRFVVRNVKGLFS